MAHIYEAFIHELGAEGSLNHQSGITLDNGFTTWHLNRLGFDWPEIDANYLTRFIKYFNDIRCWTVK